MCPELILWDWNGTLLDDVDLCVDALNRLLAGFGYPQRYDHERYRAIFGFPIEEYYVRAGFDFTKHSFAELAEKYMEDYVPASAACPLADGAIDALEAFKAAGVRQVILSASNLDTLRRQTDERGVTGYFDRLLGLGDIYAKSKVEIGLAYLKENGFDPARAVMIGDSVHDYCTGAGRALRFAVRRPPAAGKIEGNGRTGCKGIARSRGADFGIRAYGRL